MSILSSSTSSESLKEPIYLALLFKLEYFISNIVQSQGNNGIVFFTTAYCLLNLKTSRFLKQTQYLINHCEM